MINVFIGNNFPVNMADTNWLLNDLAEAKGKQELYTRQSPQMLKALREMALVQSVESSNRIEGVTVDRDRLRPLVLGNARPKDRSEQDIMGYRRALNLIHTEAETLPITPDLLRRLHRLCQEGSGDAGQFKKVDNEVIQLVPGAAPVIRFRCVKAKDTPAAVDELCLLYRHALDQDNIPPMIAIAGLVLDFLCIHPFSDGNGRMARLLTLQLLYHFDYAVGRFSVSNKSSKSQKRVTRRHWRPVRSTGRRPRTIPRRGWITSGVHCCGLTRNSRTASARSKVGAAQKAIG